jgi:MoxR-like ATPase
MDAVQHITRTMRALGMPRGHVLLAGPGGCGKQSAARFACHLMGIECFQMKLQRV